MRLRIPSTLIALFALCAPGALDARMALAAPAQFLPVGDPLEAELRVLDLYEPAPALPRLVHLHARPLQWIELGGDSDWNTTTGARGLALRRLARARALEWPGASATAGSTPRLLERAWPGELGVTLSTGVEGARRWDGRDSDWADGSGLHVRTALQVERWLAFSHLYLGQLADVSRYSDAVVYGTDLAAGTEESWLSYTSGTRWSAQLGRSRWHWGPGEEGSLLLSKTSAPLTGLMLHTRIEPWRADLFLFDATVHPGRGEQLAAHRLEWQPRPWARLGVAEAARYRSDGWQGLYLAGVIPYSVVQRLLDQDSRDTPGANRNNVLMAFDASVRVADGSRVYGELLLDDVHARTASVPNKYGWQAGWDGAGTMGGTRMTWNAEYTWMSRWTYTSFYGRTYAAQDRPIGWLEGPGSRRLRLRASADAGRDVQCTLVATRTERGEEDLGDPFVPGDPPPPPSSLAGVAELERALEGELRWWPATGLDFSVRAGRAWFENASHVASAADARWRGTLALRLTR